MDATPTGYLRQPEMELPMPGEDFSARITELLDQPSRPSGEVLAM